MSEEKKAEETQDVQEQQVQEAPSEVSLDEAESATGLKEEARNQDAIDMAEASESEDEDAPLPVPSFFVEEDDVIRVDVDVLFDKSNGTIVSVARSGLLDKDDFEAFGFASEWFEFSHPNYEDVSNYRQQCAVYRRDAGRMLTDPIAMRNFLVVWHLKDWSMRDRKGNKIELEHDEKGTLSNDSIKTVYKINPTLLDVALTLFEKDMIM